VPGPIYSEIEEWFFRRELLYLLLDVEPTKGIIIPQETTSFLPRKSTGGLVIPAEISSSNGRISSEDGYSVEIY
jgi:hypothetical protein